MFNPFMNELFYFDRAHPQTVHSKAEVKTTENGFAVDILLPGFLKDEVTIKVEGDDLIIEAKTERKLPRILATFVRRTYTVEDIDAESVVAKLENGLLNLEFTTSKKATAKSISIL